MCNISCQNISPMLRVRNTVSWVPQHAWWVVETSGIKRHDSRVTSAWEQHTMSQLRSIQSDKATWNWICWRQQNPTLKPAETTSCNCWWKTQDRRQINTDNTQTIHNLKKANNAKHSKTKLPWFSRLLWHSARKRCGLIVQRPRAHTEPWAELKASSQAHDRRH